MYKDYEIKLNAILDKHGVQKVELGIVQDGNKLYDNIVKGAQKQVSILKRVEAELNSLESDAKKLQKIEQTIEKQAKILGISIDEILPNSYAADTWVSDLNKYADKIGNIASVL
jgi:hypothetical protein